ncbi:hypothetical protein FBUS_10014 [Fasciolopsis buskii]|uniref:Uncharacterized protein n=1 Tax=Fasciolopsis buskii TaxID=27845 RepID=A0A8E0VM90_9TREM|nr:hypothetical protein FBUS_10014 [Fasciolopsis buski]
MVVFHWLPNLMRGSCNIRLNDAKLFILGMLIVLVGEVFVRKSMIKYPCFRPYSLSVTSTNTSYFGSASSHKIEEYRRTSWNSMRITLKAIYDQRYSTMYYLKAGQNDYIIMENLRHMLLSEDPNKPFLIGHVRDVSSRSVLAMYAFLHVYMACLFKFAVP